MLYTVPKLEKRITELRREIDECTRRLASLHPDRGLQNVMRQQLRIINEDLGKAQQALEKKQGAK